MSYQGPYQTILLVLIGLAIYVIPTALAGSRRHPRLAAIAALNLALGWTVLGWMTAFVWSLTGPNASPTYTADSSTTRSDRIHNFTKEHSWRPVSPHDTV